MRYPDGWNGPHPTPQPWPAWLVLLVLLVGGVALAVALAVGGDLRCERLAHAGAAPASCAADRALAGQSWT